MKEEKEGGERMDVDGEREREKEGERREREKEARKERGGGEEAYKSCTNFRVTSAYLQAGPLSHQAHLHIHKLTFERASIY